MDKQNIINHDETIQNNKEVAIESHRDLLDMLLDKDNKDPIILMDEKGRMIAFEQVAIIPHDKKGERTLFVVLKPITEIDGVADDEAIVFYVGADKNGDMCLRVEDDELIAIEIFNKYYDMMDEAIKKRKGKKEG